MRRVSPHRGDQQRPEQRRPHPELAAVRQEWLSQVFQETQDTHRPDAQVPHGEERRRARRLADGGRAGPLREGGAEGRL